MSVLDEHDEIAFSAEVSRCVSILAGEEITKLQSELQAAEARAALLAERMAHIIDVDKTCYRHHEARPDGKLPREDGGTIWLTPKEMAKNALSATQEQTEAFLERVREEERRALKEDTKTLLSRLACSFYDAKQFTESSVVVEAFDYLVEHWDSEELPIPGGEEAL